MAQASHCKQMLLGWVTGYSSHSELQLQNTVLSFKACADWSYKIFNTAVKMTRVWWHTFLSLRLLKLWYSKNYFSKNIWAKSRVLQGLIHAQKKCRASADSHGLCTNTLKPLWDIYHFLHLIRFRPQNLDSSSHLYFTDIRDLLIRLWKPERYPFLPLDSTKACLHFGSRG